ncbi:FG-GAP-like repeat-containing protein [Actinoplanes sp. NPDC049265]|uniref:FG-GAP-like repeat-containing protein n=1 Tax=Actinoplanes sp. NPDC049265 TaxID=3363902 RepID=UPI00371C3D62
MTGTRARRCLAALIAFTLGTSGVVATTTGPASAEPPPVPARPHELTAHEASERATTTGQAVEATEAANDTDTLMANPDGTMTLSRSASPTRARVGDEWKDLDPTLVQNADGSWSPKVSTTPLVLSNGGDAAVATMSGTGLSAGVKLSAAPPPPTVSGDTATYAQVMPGVDLKVTAKPDGGFSEVYEVADAQAAQNAEMATLTMPTELSGVTLTTDDTGNIIGTDRTGGTVLTAPAPTMWDSTPPPAAKSAGGPPSDRSSFRGPGTGARTASVGTRVRAGKIELTPDRKLLTGASTHYPVFIDPTFHWSVTGGKYNGWTTVAEQFPNTNYWKDTPDPRGRMQVGNPRGEIKSRTFINFPLATTKLSGAVINTATMKITQTRAWSCTPSRVNLYAPATTLSSGNSTWNAWKNESLGSIVDHQTAAHGYPGCDAAGIAFDIKSAVEADVAANRNIQTFALVAADENSDNGWKEFLETSPTFEVTYNHAPDRPTALSTSPATTCSAATPSLIGLNDVTLYARLTDRDGNSLRPSFTLWKTSDPGNILASSSSTAALNPSGQTAQLRVPHDKLQGAANNAVTQFSWRVRATDLNRASDYSVTCNFRFDASRTGKPQIDRPADGTTRIGQSVDIAVTKPLDLTQPTSYAYQLNGGPHGTVPAAADGSATITVTPTRYLNTLTVTSLSVAGNVGETNPVMFNSDAAEPAIENDIDGDDVTDVVTSGGQNSLASGLWLASGKDGAGSLAPAAANLGARGTGSSESHLPSEFDGSQAVIGRFTGTGFQDVLAYYPAGTQAGSAVILRGNGDGSPFLTQYSGTMLNIDADDLTDRRHSSPLQLTNAGYSAGNSIPDLLGTAGSAATGYYLNFYDNKGTIGLYTPVLMPQQTTPTGGLDWNTWTLAGAPGTDGVATVFLWQKTTGLLYGWRNVRYDRDDQILTYAQQKLADGWNTGKGLTLQAGDVNNDGTTDLWAIGADAVATAYLAGDTAIAPATGQKILTATHAWLLKDADTGPVTGDNIAKDSVGTSALTGSGKAGWQADELFDRVVGFDGTNSTLVASGGAVRTDADFTISAWVKPDRAGGTVISQDGAFSPNFKLWIDSTNQSWSFAMATGISENPTWVYATSRPRTVAVGSWSHLSVSFQRSTGLIDLHVNEIDAASAVLAATPVVLGATLRVGAEASGRTAAKGWFTGEVAEILTYNSVVIYDRGNTRIRDFNGDNRTDVLASYQDGSLLLYRGNGAGNFRPGYAVVGNDWNSYDGMLSPGDFDSDGKNDLIARRPDGSLWLLRGNGAGGWLNAKTGDRIGSGGWNTFTALLAPGDFDSDGKNDVIVRRGDGRLVLYRGDGAGGWLNGNGGTVLNDAGGWTAYRRLFTAGDFDGDGKPDVLAAGADGVLKLFRGNGADGWLNQSNPRVVGSGWLSPNAIITPGDFTGDGYPDVLTRDADGFLWLYRGNGAGGWLNGASPNKIGKGWNTMTKFA